MSKIQALFFDMDGVIIDTERDGHRSAFNEAFTRFGYDFHWDEQRYHRLLQVAGGKERMRHYFRQENLLTHLSDQEMTAHLSELHRCKTSIFLEMIEAGRLPLRPGIKRFMKEALDRGLQICLCTTSTEKSARTVVNTMLPDIDFAHILAGDVVTRKKPDPEIYRLALQRTGLTPASCIVIEDSAIGVQAGKGAGLKVIATTNGYTENEDISPADIIVTALGDADGERGVLRHPVDGLQFDGVLYLAKVLEYFDSLERSRR